MLRCNCWANWVWAGAVCILFAPGEEMPGPGTYTTRKDSDWITKRGSPVFFSLILFQRGAVVFALVTGSHSLQGGNPLVWIVPHLTLQLVPCVAESH